MSVEQKAIRHMQRAQELLGEGELGFGVKNKFPLTEWKEKTKKIKAQKALSKGKSRTKPPGDEDMSPDQQQVQMLNQQVRKCNEELANCKRINEDITTCLVCMDAKRDVVVQPCNHFVMCHTCAETSKTCPAPGCKTPIGIDRIIKGVDLRYDAQDFSF
jgi:hypothetical protein